MWFVLSTPNLNNPDEEEVWECPTNWITYNILSYPSNPIKGRLNFMNLVKKRTEPEDSWTNTENYNILATPEGYQEFCKYYFNNF